MTSEKLVADYWDALKEMLSPFPKNNGYKINENDNTKNQTIRADSPCDLDILHHIYSCVSHIVDQNKENNLHVRVNPQIYIDDDGIKRGYCRLQWIEVNP